MSLTIKSEIVLFERELNLEFVSKEAKVKQERKVDGEVKKVEQKYAIYNTSVQWDKKNKQTSTLQWVRHSLKKDEKEKINSFNILPGYELKITTIPGLNIKLADPISIKFNRLSITGKDKEGRYFPLPPKKKKDKKDKKDKNGQSGGTTPQPAEETEAEKKAKKEQKEGLPFTRVDYDLEVEAFGEKKRIQRSKAAAAEKKKKEKKGSPDQPQKPPTKTPKLDADAVDESTKDVTIADDGTTWYKVDKNSSGVHLRAIGFAWEDGRIHILLSASVSLVGLKFAVQGLTAKLHPTKMFEELPEFDIQGLEFGYYSKAISFGAALLKQQVKVKIDGKEELMTQFLGAALLEIKKMRLMIYGMGAYGKLKDQDSLFLYFGVNYPLGGPPFFFVQGLAIGLGYNRALNLNLDNLEDFPLVKIAFGTKSVAKDGLLGLVSDLSPYIPPALGNHFLLAGVRFDTFKILESFALMVLPLGDDFKLELYGLSRLSLGVPDKDPYVFVEIKLKADIAPAKGYVKVDGAITNNSYVLSKQARLTGGFAFYTWWKGEHKGDFVLSIGGYHPRFNKPDHYPSLDRVALKWEVSSHLKIYGEAYLALTPRALMAGLVVQALFQEDNVRASFAVGMHFLIQWEPFYYDIEVFVQMALQIRLEVCGVGVDFNLGAGANLYIKGPEFTLRGSVYVEIDTGIKTIKFSKSISVGNSIGKPDPLSWATFSTKMLPASNARFKVGFLEGLQEKIEHDDRPDMLVLHPKAIVVELESVIPAKNILYNGKEVTASTKEFSIALMNKKKLTEAKLEVQLAKYDAGAKKWKKRPKTDKTFSSQLIERKLPSALWGDPTKSNDLNADAPVDTTTGLQLTLQQAFAKGTTEPVDQSKLNFAVEQHKGKPEVLPIAEQAALLKFLGADVTQKYNQSNSFYKKANEEACYNLT